MCVCEWRGSFVYGWGGGGGSVEIDTRSVMCMERTVERTGCDFNGDRELGIKPASTTILVLFRSPTPTSPFLCLRTHTLHARTPTHAVSVPPPSPWGGGLSSTDVALINWAQHSEVGLETTWQFPAALPPHPPRATSPHPSNPSLPPPIWIT